MTSIMGPDAAPRVVRGAEDKAESDRAAAEQQKEKPPPAPSSTADGVAVEEKEKAEAEEEEDQEEELEEKPRPRRTTRARLIMVEDSEDEINPRRRGRPRGSGKTTGSSRNSPPDSTEKPKRQRGRPTGREQTTSAGDAAKKDSGGDDSPADYVHVEVGDCVLLDSGDAEDHYVALVSSVQLSASSEKPTGFTAQWYYKPDDIRDEVRASIPGGVLENEVFLSPHKDKNSIDAVVGLCNVVPPEEYAEVQQEIKRGFREKSHKPYYVCRFKYYPSRSVKKALEPLKDEEIRGGLGPQKPKVGDEYQATVPELRTTKPALVEEAVPWRRAALPAPDKSTQVWSRHVVAQQELVFRQFRALLDTIRFSVGNVVRLYREGGGDSKIMGHVRCIVLKFAAAEAIEVCASTGERRATLKGELCSPLGEDRALQILYASRFNLSHAAHECTKHLAAAQRLERDAFTKEVLIFAQIAAQEKARQAALEESSNRKRRK
jgi:hypothetical protein